MSTATPTSPTVPVVSLDNLLFDYPGANVILRSCDSYEFRVLKTYIFHSSPVLGERVLSAELPQSGADILTDTVVTPLPVTLLPDSGVILFSLLTYIFPVQPILPSTVEQVMELLSAAEKYKMDSVLTHIRNHIAQQHPPFVREENSLYIYSLAQKHGLRHEMLQAAQSTLSLPTFTIDSLDEELQYMPGILLHELWKYRQRVRENLDSDLFQFIERRAHVLFELPCLTVRQGQFFVGSSWLGQYILSIGRSPSLFDLSAFHMALTTHIQSRDGGCDACATIPRKSILEFWAALSAVYHDSITKAEPNLLLVEEETNFEGHTVSPEGCSSQLRCSDMPDADVIIQSSDNVNFRPSDHEVVDGLHVVSLPEDAEVLDSLMTFLYPVPSELPSSEDKILTLLAACQKYDMATMQFSIRSEVSRRGLLLPTGAEDFRLFAVAYRKRLIPEMKAAARLTLGRSMTFESLGEALRSFEGYAIFDLSRFHRHCRNGITSCSKVFLDGCSGPSKVWVGCPTPCSPNNENTPGEDGDKLPIWFDVVAAKIFRRNGFTSPLVKPSTFRKAYLEVLREHVRMKDCSFCMKTHTLKGEEFCVEIENQITQVWDMKYSFSIEVTESNFASGPSS
ncbi:hypothetical protein V8E53_000077 [Lactarius tabidus]